MEIRRRDRVPMHATNCIADEVRNDLAQTRRIGDNDFGHVAVDDVIDRNAHVLVLGGRTIRQDVLDTAIQIERHVLWSELALAQLAEVEDAVDDADELVAAALHQLGKVLLLAVQLGLQQPVRHSGYTILHPQNAIIIISATTDASQA